VYLISVGERAIYVGECRHLAQRFNMGYGTIQPRNCYERGQQTNCRINMLIFEEARTAPFPCSGSPSPENATASRRG
jgi:hypothetical protein